MSKFKGNFLPADHFVKQSGGGAFCFSCRMSVDIHRGTHIRMPEKFLYIFRLCAVREQVARKCVSECVKMKVFKSRNLLLRCPAHDADRACGFVSSVGTKADEGEFLVVLRYFFRHTQRVQFVVVAAGLLYLFAVVQAVKFSGTGSLPQSTRARMVFRPIPDISAASSMVIPIFATLIFSFSFQ